MLPDGTPARPPLFVSGRLANFDAAIFLADDCLYIAEWQEQAGELYVNGARLTPLMALWLAIELQERKANDFHSVSKLIRDFECRVSVDYFHVHKGQGQFSQEFLTEIHERLGPKLKLSEDMPRGKRHTLSQTVSLIAKSQDLPSTTK